MKKVLSIILVAAMLLASLLAIVPASAAEPVSEPEKKTAAIPTDEPVAGSKPVASIADIRAAGTSPVHFTQDITLTAGDFTRGNLFDAWSGGPSVIDGRGFTLKVCPDLDPTTSTADVVSIYNGSGNSYTIKNLNLTGNFVSNNNTQHAGVFIRQGAAGGATFDNVVVDVKYVINSVKGATGLLMGKTDGKNVSFNNVHVYGTLTVNTDIKLGNTDNLATGYASIGGFVGHATAGIGNFTNCTSDLDITTKGVNNTGVSGFVGYGGLTANFTNCVNNGSITMNGLYSWANAGGFMGYGNGNNTFDNCQANNTFTVSNSGSLSNAFVGGFHGKADNGSDKFINCDSSVTVDANGAVTNAAIGGFAGQIKTSTIGEADSSEVTNVAVNMTFDAAVKSTNIGGLIGNAQAKTEIYSAVVTGNITQSVEVTDAAYNNYGVGGLVGNMEGDVDSKIVDSVNRAALTVKTSRTNAGGIVAKVAGQIRLTVDGCENYGTITSDVKDASTAAVATGGIVGHVMVAGQSKAELTVTDCANHAALAPNGTTKNHMFGGIVGRIYGIKKAKIENCLNTGDVSAYVRGYAGAGGILGTIETYNYNWSQNKTLDLQILKCVNTGDVASTYTEARREHEGVGGIIGLANQINTPQATIKIEKCYNSGDISGLNNSGAGILGYSGAGDRFKLIISDCYNSGSAGAAIFDVIKQGKDSASVTDKEIIKVAYPVPEIINCVNEGEVAYGFIREYTGEIDDYNTAPYIEIKNSVNTYANAEGVPEDAKYSVTAPTDEATVIKMVKDSIHANTPYHASLELVEQVDATCTENGTKAHYVCDYCGLLNDKYSKTNEAALNIPAIHDTLELDNGYAADCEATGVLPHYDCPECGKILDAEKNEIETEIIPTIHSTLTLNEYVEPQCEEEGTLAHYACDNCDKYYDANWEELETVVIPSIHDSLELIDEVPTSCQNEGFAAHYYCDRTDDCGGKYWTAEKVETTYDDLIIPRGHEGRPITPQEDPTCSKLGFAAHCYCDECGKYFDTDYVETTRDALIIEKLPHTAGELVSATAATCCENGLKEHYRCVDCGAYLLDNTGLAETTQAALATTKGHTLTYVAEKACTHTQTTLKDGMKAHYVCSDCGNYFLAGGIRVSEDALKLYAMHIYYIDNCDEENTWKECSCGKKDEDSITPIEISPDLSADAVAPVETPAAGVVDGVVEAPAEAPVAVTAPTASLSAEQVDGDAAKTNGEKADGEKADDTKTDDAKGCKSAIGATVVVMTATLALGATTLLKKKKD